MRNTRSSLLITLAIAILALIALPTGARADSALYSGGSSYSGSSGGGDIQGEPDQGGNGAPPAPQIKKNGSTTPRAEEPPIDPLEFEECLRLLGRVVMGTLLGLR
jgi:hypothetical protein